MSNLIAIYGQDVVKNGKNSKYYDCFYFDGTEGIVINPGAFTHYSYAIHDALVSITVPKVEIHISDITKREEFRKVSVTKAACDHQIYGKGLEGYLMAIDFIMGNKRK